MFRSFLTLACFGLITVTGCSRIGADRLAVNGTVTFKNQPLGKGTVNFQLEDNANPLMSVALIEEGKFSLPQDKGLKPGTYLVRISSANAIVKDTDQAPGDSSQVAKELIPASWNSDSKQKVEVKAGATEFTFDIK